MMSTPCPSGHLQDEMPTAFGLCMDAVRTLDPTRPVPSRTAVGKGLNTDGCSPDPFPAQREVWHHLTAALGVISPNDHGRSWPLPRRRQLAALLAEFDHDLCIAAARSAREIVVSQDRAPNITALFEKKLRELAEVRTAVRSALEAA